jgi:hypothetical protein
MEEQLLLQKNYVSPHPKSARKLFIAQDDTPITPPSEAEVIPGKTNGVINGDARH